MTPTHTPASVCVAPRLEEIAARAVAYLRTLGPGAELASAALAEAIAVERPRLVASLVPLLARGELLTRGLDAGAVSWRLGVA